MKFIMFQNVYNHTMICGFSNAVLQVLTSPGRENRINFMQHKLYTIIALLIFALLIQNTCPHGFAGKSTVFASCSHCPHKQMFKSYGESGQLSIISNHMADMPLFVLEMPNPQPTFQLVLIASPQPIIPNSYKNTVPDELLRPPQA